MNIFDLLEQSDQDAWLGRIALCDWVAAHFLCSLVREGKIYELLGKNTRLFILADGDELISFCTLSDMDDVQPTSLTPWIGFLFTAPDYRRRGFAGELIDKCVREARALCYDSIYISTNHEGFYERYGFKFTGYQNSVDGQPSRVYERKLTD